MADFVFLSKRLPWVSDISSEAYLFFHGWSRRRGAAHPLRDYQYGDSLEHELVVMINAFGMPHAFQPGLNLIVPRDTRSRLARTGKVAFLQVEFGKVFDVPYEPDQERYPDLDGEELLEQFSVDASARSRLGDWYELIVPHYDRISEEYKEGGTTVRLERDTSSVPLELHLTRQLSRDYPVISKDGLILSAEAFAEVESLVDDRFFRVTPIALN